MDHQLVDYVDKNVLPLYARNDWAHQLWHIRDVIKKSLKLAKKYAVDVNMVYTIAAFHDLGCFISREKHEEVSARLLGEDEFICGYFSDDEIRVMKEAIMDHRGSLEYEPRSIYGKIIASADRFTTIEGVLRSTHGYTLQFFPNLSWEEMIDRSYEYIKKKYGSGGYAKSHIPNPDFEKFLAEIEQYLQNRGLFERKLTEVDEFLRKEYELRSK